MRPEQQTEARQRAGAASSAHSSVDSFQQAHRAGRETVIDLEDGRSLPLPRVPRAMPFHVTRPAPPVAARCEPRRARLTRAVARRAGRTNGTGSARGVLGIPSSRMNYGDKLRASAAPPLPAVPRTPPLRVGRHHGNRVYGFMMGVT
jgi:hypothetical protein